MAFRGLNTPRRGFKKCVNSGSQNAVLHNNKLYYCLPKLVFVLTTSQATRRSALFPLYLWIDSCLTEARLKMFQFFTEPVFTDASFLATAWLFHLAIALSRLTGSQRIHENDLGTTTSLLASFDQPKKCNVLPLWFPDTSRRRWSSFFWLRSRVHYDLPLCKKAVISADFKLYSAKISTDNYQCNRYYSNNPK